VIPAPAGGSIKTAQWRRTRALVLARDGWVCQLQWPGVCLGRANQVDHILPREHGGTNDMANLRAACRPCNLARRLDAPPPPGVGVPVW